MARTSTDRVSSDGEAIRRRVGRNIRTIAKYRGVTVKDLAVALRISEPQIYGRLTGSVGITADQLWEISEVLEIDPGLFFEEDILRGAKIVLQPHLAAVPDLPIPEGVGLPVPLFPTSRPRAPRTLAAVDSDS